MIRIRSNALPVLVVLAAFACFASTAHAVPVTWVNETNLASEADFVILQFPAAIAVTAGNNTPSVFGQVFETGVTPGAGANPSVLADVGYGASGSDPRTDPSWVWFAALFNVQVGNNDEYQRVFAAPLVNGTYSYTYRFSVDGGLTYTAADLNGAGSNAGLTFDPSNLGVMTVTGGLDAPPPTGPAVPEPATLGLVALGGLAVTLHRSLRRNRDRA